MIKGVFPLTLNGHVREWWWRLPRGSVKTFEQLCRKFAKQFHEVMTPEDDMMELIGIKQGKNEALKDS